MRSSFPSRMTIAIVAAIAWCTAFSSVRAETSARDTAALQQATLVYIATVRKDGNQSRPAPVWFTVTKENQILIETSPDSWKAKRIRRGSPAIIWIGSATGPAFIGKAEITNDETVLNRIVEDYPRKYLEARIGIHRPTLEKFKNGGICAIRITPMRDLPDGFASAPGTPAPKLEEAVSR